MNNMIEASEKTIEQTGVLILGAGMAGLVAARELQAAGRDVLVLDKGRGVGGRLATRRIDAATFDHGAQFMTVRDPRLEQISAEWRQSGALKEWFGGPQAGYIRWRGHPGMTAIAKELARGLRVRLSTRVTALEQQAQGWLAYLEGGARVQAREVILTAPAPQSLALLSAGAVDLPERIRATLEGIEYEPCIAVMATLKGPSTIPDPGWLAPIESPIGWLADNQRKGISQVPAVTIHASPAFSREHWEDDRSQSAQQLLETASEWLGAGVSGFEVHAWRYARVIDPLETGCLVAVDRPRLVIAGDAFGGARVEGAAISGWAAASALLA